LEGRPHLLGIFRDITARKQAEKELRDALDTIQKLKDRLEAENIYLREEVKLKDRRAAVVSASDPMKYAMHRIRQVAPTNATVLLTGETGTGKNVFARLLHEESKRRDKPFVNVACAGLPANLIESELFGREKGAFTGSTARQIGRFELAHGGTVFLDEIGELPMELQAKLLRVLEDGEFERLGSPHPVKVDVRVIASTNRNLEEEIKNDRFRRDLFYRLNAFPVTLPALRDRREDIPLLVEFFVDRFSKRFSKRFQKVSGETLQALEDYAWPGNVRELINVVERAVIVSSGPELRLAEQLRASPVVCAGENVPTGTEARQTKDLAEIERDYILQTLRETGWRIEGPRGAALLLGMNPSTLRTRMRKLNIRRP
jgi:transcriptional regulator with GAF, ATPase, and Fis domain